MKMTAFRNIATCSLIKYTDVSEVHTASIIRAICTSETSVNFNETTLHSIPEGCHLNSNPPEMRNRHFLGTASYNVITAQTSMCVYVCVHKVTYKLTVTRLACNK
jgi:hypothetical protein